MFSCHPLVEYFRDIAGYGQGCSMMTFLSLFGESETVPKYWHKISWCDYDPKWGLLYSVVNSHLWSDDRFCGCMYIKI